MKTRRAFFTHVHTLVNLFSAHNFKPDGMEDVRFCEWERDIRENLTRWAAEGDLLCYSTEDFWYVFQKEVVRGVDVVFITRYVQGQQTLHSVAREDLWFNLSSVEMIGRKFANEHTDKRIPLFPEGLKTA